MSGFLYLGGVLHADSVAVPDIATAVGTPFYCYSSTVMRARYDAYAKALRDCGATVFFAVKANANIAVIRTFAEAGAGADVVSVGEMQRSLAAGVPADRILFAGVGKTREELAAALQAGILQINVESAPELHAVNEVATALGRQAAVGLRVNPDIDARTHAKITTGRKENKFGVDLEMAPELFALAANLPGLTLNSLSMHIGSQLTDLAPYRQAYARLRELTLQLRQRGHAVEHLDLGGGLGIAYGEEDPPGLEEYAAIVADAVGDLGCRLSCEPGRYLVGDAGILVTRVIYVKDGTEKRFVIADAAMNDLIRPTLYEAHHRVLTVSARGDDPTQVCDLVGPICESGDYLARSCLFPALEEADLLAVTCAGAYGAVMASTYNSRPLIPEVMVRDSEFAVIRQRQSVAEAMRLEHYPDWLNPDLNGSCGVAAPA